MDLAGVDGAEHLERLLDELLRMRGLGSAKLPVDIGAGDRAGLQQGARYGDDLLEALESCPGLVKFAGAFSEVAAVAAVTGADQLQLAVGDQTLQLKPPADDPPLPLVLQDDCELVLVAGERQPRRDVAQPDRLFRAVETGGTKRGFNSRRLH